MRRRRYGAGVILSAMLLALLSACGGGGSSDTASSVDSSTAGTVITAVDPYVIGAVFQEIDADGNVRQISTPSGENGLASFEQEVQLGSTVVAFSTGLHNWAPFKGTLKRKVEQADSSFVVSPLTTLAAEISNSKVLNMLQSLDDDPEFPWSFDNVDIEADPMLALQGKTNPAFVDYAPLIANLAVNAALNMIPPDSADLDEVVKGVVSRLMVDVNGNGTSDVVDAMTAVAGADFDDCVSSFAAITDYLIRELAEEVLVTYSADDDLDPADEDLIALTREGVGELHLVVLAMAVEGFSTVELLALLEGIDLPDIKALVETSATKGAVVIDSEGGVGVPLLTVRERLEEGYTKFLFDYHVTDEMVKILAEAESFYVAKLLIGMDDSATQADKDEARFLGSFADLVLLFNPFSDFTDNGLNTLGDIYDAFGVPLNANRSWALPVEEGAEIDPVSETPTSGEFQQALATMLLSRLQIIVDNLALVSSEFILQREELGGTEFDYGDVLFMRGLAQAMHAQVSLQLAYNLNANLYDSQSMTKEEFLAVNQAFGSLSSGYANHLAAAKTMLAGAADDLLAAVNAIEAESDFDADQTDDLIAFYEEDAEDMAENFADIKAFLANFKVGLSGPVVFNEGTFDEVSLDFSYIFGGIGLREKAPEYSGNVPGYFPDATMGGVITDTVQLDINEDQDDDGSPDCL